MPDPREFERAYLGAVIMNPDFLLQNPIEAQDLQDAQHREILIAMKSVLDKHGKLDYLLLSQEVNNPGLLIDIINSTANAYNADAYAREIRKAAERRDYMLIASELANDAAHGAVDPANIIQKLTEAVRTQGTTDGLTEAAQNYLEYVEQREVNPSDVWGIPAPWSKFNQVTGGLHKKESVLIFGESGVGKTVAVLQMGYHAAMTGYKVDFYELEMSKENLMSRMVAMHSGIPTQKVHRGKLTQYEKQKVMEAVKVIRELPIRISDATHWTSSEIRADQQKKRDRADMVIVDYLALLQDKAENAYERVESAAKALRQMAKDLDQAVLTVGSQVKDGSIKGTAEVKYAQDMTWIVEKLDKDIVNDPRVDMRPDKLRNMGEFKMVPLEFEVTDDQFKTRLPMFKERS